MTAVVARIYRHPIKSIGAEDLGATTLSPGQSLPLDREWAVLNDRAKVARLADGRASAWGAKANFLTGRAGPALMAVTASTQANGRLVLDHPDLRPLDIDPDAPADQAEAHRLAEADLARGRPRPDRVGPRARPAAHGPARGIRLAHRKRLAR